MPSVSVRNFGCRVNQAEAFAWADALRERGLRLEADCGRSDVVLINSCTLTGRADRDVRKFIRTIGRESPETGIVVAGCYAERAPGELAGLPNVVAVLPASAKGRVAEAVAGIAAASRGRDEGAAGPRRPDSGRRAVPGPGLCSRSRTAATTAAPSASSRACAGRSASVPPGEVAAAVRALAARGFREIVLAGIHLASYGRDLEPRRSLLELLREIGGAAAAARLRLSSLDPNLVDDALVAHRRRGRARSARTSISRSSTRRSASSGRWGARAMPRSYERVLGELRRLAPDAALGADVIVGFPGETDGDFDELRAFLDASPLTYVHVFPYSPRPGTPASGRPRVADGVVTARARALRRLSAGKDLRFRGRFTGPELEAVVIGRSEPGGRGPDGRTASRSTSPFRPRSRRELVRVRIGRVLPLRTEGEVVV